MKFMRGKNRSELLKHPVVFIFPLETKVTKDPVMTIYFQRSHLQLFDILFFGTFTLLSGGFAQDQNEVSAALRQVVNANSEAFESSCSSTAGTAVLNCPNKMTRADQEGCSTRKKSVL